MTEISGTGVDHAPHAERASGPLRRVGRSGAALVVGRLAGPAGRFAVCRETLAAAVPGCQRALRGPTASAIPARA